MTASTVNGPRPSNPQQRERQAIVTAGIDSLERLVLIAKQHSGQSAVVGRFLLGLYNGPDYPFDLTDLRGLDVALFVDCMRVLIMDSQPEVEVHERIANGNAIWGEFAERWGSRSASA